MEKPGSLFYVVGITALVVFFSPFVMIYLLVKGPNMVRAIFSSRAHRVSAVEQIQAATQVQSLRLGQD